MCFVSYTYIGQKIIKGAWEESFKGREIECTGIKISKGVMELWFGRVK